MGNVSGKQLKVSASFTFEEAKQKSTSSPETLFFPTDSDRIVFNEKVYGGGIPENSNVGENVIIAKDVQLYKDGKYARIVVEGGTGCRIGSDVKVEAGVVLGSGAYLGSSVNIGTEAVIGNNTDITSNTATKLVDSTVGRAKLSVGGVDMTFGTGVNIGTNVSIGDKASIGNNANVGINSKIYGSVVIGTGSVIQEGVMIHKNAIIGTNAELMQDGSGFIYISVSDSEKYGCLLGSDVEIGSGIKLTAGSSQLLLRTPMGTVALDYNA